MQLTWLDWAVIAAYFLLNIAIGFYYKQRAGQNVDEFFLSGRNVPWWLAGTSMVATTFAADTPLAVTGMVAKNGIAGNWLWWNFVAGMMLTVFLYARLWRRSGVTTDIEFSEIRYAGPPAAFLRGFRALYLSIPINLLVLGWVNLAMKKILITVLGVSDAQALWIVFGMMAITALISTLSGLWGVLVTDAVQFVIKMTMVIVLAFSAVAAAGGIDAMKAKLAVLDAARGNQGSSLDFVPDVGSAWMPVLTFCVYLGMQWWASWYPGSEPGGGGYVAQRMFCARDERHSLLATLWFNIAHFALRPWPWILTALASMVLYPDLQDKESGYVKVMVEHLPPYLRGTMLAAFAAAYMSTIATQLNWGASYLVNDFYRRFLQPNATQPNLVAVSQWATVFLMAASIIATQFMDSVQGAWEYLIMIGAGTGLVLLLRWYWWRVNAYSEISAMVIAAVTSTVLKMYFDTSTPLGFAWGMIWTTGITTAGWIAVTLLTPPEPREVLLAFYRKTHPSRFGWGPIAAQATDVTGKGTTFDDILCWLAGCVLIYGCLLGTGKLILGEPLGATLVGTGLAAGAFMYWNLSKRGWSTVVE